MPITLHLPQVEDPALEVRLQAAVRDALGQRADEEDWLVAIFRSQDGARWDIAIKGPRCRAFLDGRVLEELPERLAERMRAAIEQAKVRRSQAS